MPIARLAIEWVIVLLLAVAAASGAAFTLGGEQLSNLLLDHEMSWIDREIDSRIVIAKIDEQSLTSTGRWPWSREEHARVIDRLTDSAAGGIGYDVLFIEPASAEEDAALARSIARSGKVAVPAYAIFPGTNGRSFDVQMPIEPIRSAAAGVGHVNVLFDGDGKVRRARMQAQGNTEQMPHLMQVLARQVSGADRQLPTELMIPLAPAGAFQTIPVDSVLRGEVPKSVLENKIVLVGATAQGLGDILSVSGPAGSVMPGVEIQANLLSAILQGTWIRDVDKRTSFVAAVVVLLLTMALFWNVGPDRALLVAIAAVGLALVSTALLLVVVRMWVTPLPLVAAILVAYPLWSWRRLTALSRFVDQETRELVAELDVADGARSARRGLDVIAQAASRLKNVIGELRDRRSFLGEIIESAPDALCVLDDHGRVVVANGQAKAIFGEGLGGRSAQAMLKRLAPGDAATGSEVQLDDGRTLLIKRARFKAQGRKRSGAILRLADISERRTAEREREQMLEFLSHDLRAPQAAILTLLDGVKAKDDSGLPAQRIRGYAEKSLKLADDFVQLAKLSMVTPKLEPLDLLPMVEEAVDGLFEFARRRDVTVSVTAPEDLPEIVADASLLVRALGNLLDNAIKYSAAMQSVACELASVTLPHGALVVRCTITDKGEGIPEARMKALFERFGPTGGAAGLSSGLGLTFVKKAMDLMQAKVECRSSSNGTTFDLTFAARSALRPE